LRDEAARNAFSAPLALLYRVEVVRIALAAALALKYFGVW